MQQIVCNILDAICCMYENRFEILKFIWQLAQKTPGGQGGGTENWSYNDA
jgi:hypothetical protein